MKVSDRREGTRAQDQPHPRPPTASPAELILRLQRSAGNRAVARLVSDRAGPRPLSRAFAGTYGAAFTSTLNPAAATDDLATAAATNPRKRMQALFRDTEYAALWNALHALPQAIVVESGRGNNYDSERVALQFNVTMLMDLMGMANGTLPFDAAQFGSHLSAVTHEFSHASDHLTKNRAYPSLDEGKQGSVPMNAHVKGVLDTELRAWAREAMSAFQVATQTASAPEPERQRLITAWKTVTPAMVFSSAAVRRFSASNEVVLRILHYTEREYGNLWTSKDAQFWAAKANTWLDDNDHSEWLKAHTLDMKNLVATVVT